MGNSLIGAGKKRVKVMKINGETLKLRVPLRARDVTQNHPGHVLLDSEAVRHFGIRARPLEADHELKAKKIYFLIETPKLTDDRDRDRGRGRGRFDDDQRLTGRRVQSGISMSAKDRLECLMLARRSASDLTLLRPAAAAAENGGPSSAVGPVRVTMRLPRAQVAKLVEESRDEADVAEKIIGIYMRSGGAGDGYAEEMKERRGGAGDGDAEEMKERRGGEWKFSGGAIAAEKSSKARQKRVSFLPIEEGEIRLAVDSLS